MREVNQAGRNLTTVFEGIRLIPYKDTAGNWTWGIGHKQQPGEQVPEVITQEECNQLFEKDLSYAASTVEKLVTENLTNNQFAALTDFVFNLGSARFASSTLLADLDDNDISDAIGEFTRWIYAAGKPSVGLEKRREAEKTLFLTPDTEST